MTTTKPTNATPDGSMETALTYADNVLHNAGFQFHPRIVGERLNLKRISIADIDAIVRNVDTDTLSSLLEDITFCEITEDDLRLHSNDTLVKLYQANQLIIEYLVDARDKLSMSLNSLAEKHASQKRESESLTTELAKKNKEVAKLKDELYWTSMVPTSPSRVDPSLYPSQEPCAVKKTSSFFEDGAFALLLDRSTSKKNKTAITPTSIKAVPRNDFIAPKDRADGAPSGILRLHIVSSTNAILIQINVEGSTTVQKLKSELVSRLLIDGDSTVDYESHSLFHRDAELSDTSRILDHYQVTNNAALVLMPRPVENADSISLAKTTLIELKLDELTSIASESHEELKRALQLQLSIQKSNKDACVQEIGKQIKAMEESLREEIQSQVENAVTKHYGKHEGAKAHAADCETSMSKASSLDLDEMMIMKSGYFKEGGTQFLQGDSLQISEILLEGDDPVNTNESRGKFDVPITIETTAEVFNAPSEIEMHSPQEKAKIEALTEKVDFTLLFNLPSEIEMHSPQEKAEIEAEKVDFTLFGRNSPDSANQQFVKSTGSLDDIDKSVDLDAVKKITDMGADHTGYLLYKGYNEREVPPLNFTPAFHSNRSAASLTSSEMNSEDPVKGMDLDFHDDLEFRVSDESDGVVVKDCRNDDTTPSISFGMPAALDMDDMTSVAISPNKIWSNGPDEKKLEENPNVKPDGKKKGPFSFMKKIRKNPNKTKPKSTMVEI